MASGLREYREFFRQFRHHFHTTGSVVPSGSRLARALTRPLRQRDAAARILEVGPGTGAVTRHIVPVLEADDRLDLVELNASFVAHLQQRLREGGAWWSAADRIRLFHCSLETFESDGRYDFIVSGLPLNNFPAELVEGLFGKFFELLAPGGCLSFFEYMYLRRARSWMSLGDARARLRALDEVITQHLTRGKATRDWVFLNAPPAWAHHVRRDVVATWPGAPAVGHRQADL
jgi:phospholipid N-methyltransferase